MIFRIEDLAEKRLIGQHLTMSLSANRTADLWRNFMSRRKEIANAVGGDLYSLQVYPSQYFEKFEMARQFEKWALIEVTDFDFVPNGLEKFTLPAGLYAVFPHKGPASEGSRTFEYIFRSWLPSSDFALDDRPHFEVLGEKYKHEQADSEEEIWIPVRRKK